MLQHQKLQESVGDTKEVIEELLSFSKDEITKYSSFSVNEFKKVTQSIDTISGTFRIINECKFYIYILLIHKL